MILSNAMNDQIQQNVAMLGAPFHRVYTAQQAQAYKPRLQAFEYMLDSLGCNPEDVLHVSSSLRYDLMSADDIGIVQQGVRQPRATAPATPPTATSRSRTSAACPVSSACDATRPMPRHEARAYWTRHRAGVPAAGARSRAGAARRRRRRRRLHRSVGGAGAGQARRHRWSCWRPASVSRPRPRAQRRPCQQRPRARLCRGRGQGAASSARAPGTTPTTRRSTRSSASCATRRIDCDFVRRGKLKLADASRRTATRCRAAPSGWCATASTPTCEILRRAARARRGRRASVSSAACCYKRSGQMHMGRFARRPGRRRPSATARRSTPRTACSGSSA